MGLGQKTTTDYTVYSLPPIIQMESFILLITKYNTVTGSSIW